MANSSKSQNLTQLLVVSSFLRYHAQFQLLGVPQDGQAAADIYLCFRQKTVQVVHTGDRSAIERNDYIAFTQAGANGTATFTINSGSLPSGLSLASTGVLSGTPLVPGSFPITVKVTDSNGCTGISPTYTLVINCQTITVTNPGVSTGTVDAAFSQNFTQTGVGTHTPAVFTINSGSLPSGLSLSSAGVLSGTPLVPGSFPITVKVTDANGCTGIGATYTLVIACQTITVTNPATTSSVFNTALVPANFTFTQTGVGTHTPANFTINSGTLPTGLSLSSAGVLSGTPTQTGTFDINIQLTDTLGRSVSWNYSITIH